MEDQGCCVGQRVVHLEVLFGGTDLVGGEGNGGHWAGKIRVISGGKDLKVRVLNVSKQHNKSVRR